MPFWKKISNCPEEMFCSAVAIWPWDFTAQVDINRRNSKILPQIKETNFERTPQYILLWQSCSFSHYITKNFQSSTTRLTFKIIYIRNRLTSRYIIFNKDWTQMIKSNNWENTRQWNTSIWPSSACTLWYFSGFVALRSSNWENCRQWNT